MALPPSLAVYSRNRKDCIRRECINITFPCLLPMCRRALGHAVAALGTALQQAFGPLTQQSTEQGLAQRAAAQSELAKLLQAAYRLFTEHVVPPSVPDQAPSGWADALHSTMVGHFHRHTASSRKVVTQL